jgi:hypothetical protein
VPQIWQVVGIIFGYLAIKSFYTACGRKRTTTLGYNSSDYSNADYRMDETIA